MKIKRLSKGPLAGLVAAIILSLVSAQALAGGRTVRVGDNYFGRPGGTTLTVHRGTTVTWAWRGQVAHNVTVTRGPARFRSRTQTRGTFRERVTRPGVYRIVCTIHGAAMSMKLRVT